MGKQVGWNKVAYFNGGTLCVTATSWDEMVDSLDVTDACSGGIQELLSGILRGDGHVEGFLYSDAMPSGYGIYPGNNGTLAFYWGSAINDIVPCMVVKVGRRSAVAGTVQYGFDVKLNGLAGTYIRAS